MEYPTSETHFVSTKLQLPLFLTSRNRIRINRFWEVRYYIAKKAKCYAPCVEEKDEDESEIDDCRNRVPEIRMAPLKSSGKSDSKKSWKHAPNRYNVPNEIGIRRKGMKGAFWSQLKRTPIGGKQVKVRNVTAFYEIPRDSEKLTKCCHWHKGKFLTDPRRRRPTSRFMVSNIFTCWRNPKDPGPTRYFIGIFTKEMFPKLKTKTAVPYKFLRYSCVPERKTTTYKKKSSFDPGPGRYELCDDEDDYLFLLKIQKQKELKFRRQPFKRILLDQQPRGPLWRHVHGYGFTRLFRGPPLRPVVVVSKRKARKVDRDVNLFPNAEYIRMITNPDRIILSFRTEPIIRKIKPTRFDCLVKVIIRRQLRNNKKIAFSSGTPRFPDSDMPTSRKTAKPPPLVDHPVMRVHPCEIVSKLHSVPERLRGIFNENRIRAFKFQPFPPIKLLLDENEIHAECVESRDIYCNMLNPYLFYKEEFKKFIK